jgi:hypothetical protein
MQDLFSCAVRRVKINTWLIKHNGRSPKFCYCWQYSLEPIRTNSLTLHWPTGICCEGAISLKLFGTVDIQYSLSQNLGVSRDSSFDTAARYGLDGPVIESRRGRDFPHASIPALGFTQPPVRWVPGLFSGVKRSGRGVGHPPSSSAEVHERVELYLYSIPGSSWSVIGCTLLFHPYRSLNLYASVFHLLFSMQTVRTSSLQSQVTIWKSRRASGVKLCQRAERTKVVTNSISIKPPSVFTIKSCSCWILAVLMDLLMFSLLSSERTTSQVSCFHVIQFFALCVDLPVYSTYITRQQSFQAE